MEEERTTEGTRPLTFNEPWNTLDHWLERVTSMCLTAAGIFVFIMAVAVSYGVVRRYFFNSPDSNAYLVVLVLMLACATIVLAHIQRLNRNITVDYFGQRFHPKVRMVIKHIATPVLGLVFCVPLVLKSWGTAAFALFTGERTVTVTTIPVFPLRALVVFGAILICLTLVAQLIRGVSLFIKGNYAVIK